MYHARAENYNLCLDYFHLIMHAYKSPISRFIKSMNIDFEKWHDGIGYDLEALKEANDKEREVFKKNPHKQKPSRLARDRGTCISRYTGSAFSTQSCCTPWH